VGLGLGVLISNLGGGSPLAKIAAFLAEPSAELAHKTANDEAKLPMLVGCQLCQ